MMKWQWLKGINKKYIWFEHILTLMNCKNYYEISW